MKNFRNVLTVAATALLLFTFGRAQDLDTKPTVIQGKAGKMLFFDKLAGFYDCFITRNNQYYVMRSEGGSVVYNIATGEALLFEGETVIAYNDEHNYATNREVVINRNHYDAWIGLASRYMPAMEGVGGFEPIATDTSLRYMHVNTYTVDSPYKYITVIVDVLADNGEGAVIATLPHYHPIDEPGYGSWALGSSNDMSVLAGRTYHRAAFSNFTPGFWDVRGETPQIFYIGGDERGDDTDGTLYAVNNDGSVIAGDAEERGVIVFYNREDKTWTKKYIPYSPGYNASYCYALDEKGRVLGIDQVEAFDIYSRKGYLYNYNTDRKYRFTEYLTQLYGIDYEQAVDDLFSPGTMSDDGNVIGGYTIVQGTFIPYLFVFDEVQLHAAPVSIAARQLYGTETVRVIWDQPLMEQYELKGYNVYRNNVKVNGQLLPATAVSFEDPGVDSGNYVYSVEAVYTDDSAAMAAGPEIRVIPIGACQPVTDIYHSTLYNSTVTLRWGLPSATVTGTAKNSPKGYTAKQELDFIKIYNTESQSANVPVRIGNHYILSDFNTGTFTICNAENWNIESTVYVEGIGGIYDMTVHGNSIWVVTRGEKVFELAVDEDDPTDISLANQFTTLFKEAVNIAYVEGQDGEDDYLLVGDWDGIVAYPLWTSGGTDTIPLGVRYQFPEGLEFRSTEVYNGYLYVGDSRFVPAPPTAYSTTSAAGIRVYDMKTGEEVSYTNLFDNERLIDACLGDYGYMGGLTVETMEDGTVALMALVEASFWYKQVVYLEIQSAPEVQGYNVYRNGVKLNSDLIKARHYVEDIETGGTYVYAVEYVANCHTRSDEYGIADTVVIKDRGTCEPARNLKAKSTNKSVVLDWDWQAPEGGIEYSLVEFRVLRDGERLDGVVDFKYRDKDVEDGHEYTYQIEAFFENSCSALSNSVKIIPDFAGSEQAPSAVQGKVIQEGGQVKAQLSWNLPYFEEPMAYGYCNVPYNAVAFWDASVTQSYALIGWDSADMSHFDDLYLVGAEYFMFQDKLTAWQSVVVVDDRIVYQRSINERIKKEAWNTVYFDQVFPMKQQLEIAVGFFVKYNPEEINNDIFAFDLGPGKRGYSDIVSVDGNSWAYLADNDIDANLCINALVVRLRDLEEAKNAPDPEAYLRGKAVRLDRSMMTGGLSLALSTPVADAPKSETDKYTLKGFNVYREGEKLNASPLSELEYKDAGVKTGEEYEYEISAVYADNEIKAEPIYLEIDEVSNEGDLRAAGLKIYPNPVSAVLNIEGEYNALCVMDVNGRVLMNNIRDKKSVSMESLPQGIYFCRFTAANGRTVTVKVVKK